MSALSCVCVGVMGKQSTCKANLYSHAQGFDSAAIVRLYDIYCSFVAAILTPKDGSPANFCVFFGAAIPAAPRQLTKPRHPSNQITNECVHFSIHTQ